MNSWVIGGDLGGTKIELGLVSPQNQIVARKRIATQHQRGAHDLVERIAACVAELTVQAPPGERIVALGICTPGPVDSLNGVLLDPPNIHGLHHTPLGHMLSQRLGMPAKIEHDAKAAALGEYYYGAGRGTPSMIYVIVGTGVGAAIIIDGQVYRGMHNFAGEFGHTMLEYNGELCSCGNRGCVETLISGPWLARRYEMALQQESMSDAPGEERRSISPMTGETVALLARQGDPCALQVIGNAGDALGTAIATLAMIVDIELFVVGGSVAKCGDLLLEPARRAVPHHAHASVAANIQIMQNQLDVDAPILGCAWLARQT